jgi:hypothetical protein
MLGECSLGWSYILMLLGSFVNLICGALSLGAIKEPINNNYSTNSLLLIESGIPQHHTQNGFSSLCGSGKNGRRSSRSSRGGLNSDREGKWMMDVRHTGGRSMRNS